MDSFDALLANAAFGEEEKYKALTRALRREKNAADIFSMSTIAPFSRTATRRSEQIQKAAERGGVLREAVNRSRLRDEQFRLGEEGRNRRNQEMIDYYRERDKADNVERLQKAIIAARGKGGGGSYTQRYGTASQQKEFEESAAGIENLFESVENFKDEYGNQSGMPKMGDFQNFLAAEAPMFATDPMEEQRAWWGDYKQFYELTKRHELFGSALTEPEQRQWRQATISPNMKGDEIRKKLAIQKRLAAKVAKKAREVALIKGRDPEYVSEVMDDITTNYGGGNSVPTSVDEARNMGWELREDAQGNRAYVNPDDETQYVEE